MSRSTTSQFFSDHFWSESSKVKPAIINKKKCDFKDFLFCVDDAPDFHDPYSDLNLFLSQKIKQEMLHCGNSKKWSLKLQEDLLSKITPEFQKRFPHYRLGVSALKKTWEKISYFSEAMQCQKEAITQDGKINIPFFIKENLKQLSIFKPSSSLPSYYFAHQLAVKLSECIAAIDGTRPKLDQLTKTIWAVQRHVISCSKPEEKNPYEEYDKIDKLIVKTILEITARDPQIGQSELEHQVKESLFAIQEVPGFTSLDKITCNISSLLAEKLYPTCAFHTTFLSEQKKAIQNFIKRQIQLCKGSYDHNSLSDLVRRILALYMLASGLPNNLTHEEVTLAIGATYPTLRLDKPALPQAFYAFIAAESVLMKTEEFCHSVDYVIETITEAYEETKYLPMFKGKEAEILEIVIWKLLNESEGLLEKLPYKIGQKIEEEIANILIEHPNKSFGSIVSLTSQSFKKAKEITIQKNGPDIERKIYNWTIQGDMLCKFLKVNPDSCILKLIKAMWQEDEMHELFVSRVAQKYLTLYPQLTSYAPQVTLQIWILYKHFWYAQNCKSQETSLERFLKWHALHLASCSLTKEQIILQIEETCKKCLPLIPFDRHYIGELVQEIKEIG